MTGKIQVKSPLSADEIGSLFWMAFGLVVMYFAKNLGVGNPRSPGPGLITFWSGVAVCGLSLLVFLQNRTKRNEQNRRKIRQLWTGTDWPKALIVTVALLAYALVFSHVGFLISTTILLIFLFKAVRPMSWVFAVGGAILSSFLAFAIFDLWLQVQLPRGLIERILF